MRVVSAVRDETSSALKAVLLIVRLVSAVLPVSVTPIRSNFEYVYPAIVRVVRLVAPDKLIVRMLRGRGSVSPKFPINEYNEVAVVLPEMFSVVSEVKEASPL